MYCDNASTFYMVVNPVQHERNKHTTIDYYFVRKRVAHGDLMVRYIPTRFPLANIFTKGLSSKLLEYFRVNLSVHPLE